MPWTLKRWKDCDGGCSERSPTFPDLANTGRVPGRHPSFMAGDKHKLQEHGGVSPDGMPWAGGNSLHKELWSLYNDKGRDASGISIGDLRLLSNFGQLFDLDWPEHGVWQGQAIQYFLDRDFGWPVRTHHIQAVLNRMAELGIWNPNVYDSGIQYDVVYSDAEREAFAQEFDISDTMSLLERQLEEPACCHYWEQA